MDAAGVHLYHRMDDREANLRGLVRRTFLSHHGSLLCRRLLAYRGRLYRGAISARQVRAQGRADRNILSGEGGDCV
jgi:hypothetical protein